MSEIPFVMWTELDSDGDTVPFVRVDEDSDGLFPPELRRLFGDWLSLLFLICARVPDCAPSIHTRECETTGARFYWDGAQLPCPLCGRRLMRC